MFGSYQFGVPLDFDQIKIETNEDSGLYVYRREPADVTKIISSKSNLLVSPIEPVTQPKSITNHLLIEMKSPVFLAPGSATSFFVTFPVEIGIFTEIKKSMDLGFFDEAETNELIDSFTLTTSKYTLYGTPNKGIICKSWKSDIHTKIPDIDPLREGAMNVEIQNSSNRWVHLSKLVFNAYHMRLYYSSFSYMNARVKITNSKKAETSFKEEPLENMKKAIKLFSSGKMQVMEKETFAMEWEL
jgi:hypothetical protein